MSLGRGWVLVAALSAGCATTSGSSEGAAQVSGTSSSEVDATGSGPSDATESAASTPAPGPSTSASPTSAAGELGTAEALAPEQVGTLQTCLVTGERFKVEKDSPAVKHEGKAHAFCCDGCAHEFRDDPKSFFTGAK